MTLIIRPAFASDADQIWVIFEEVVRSGDTYAFAPNISRDEGLKLWLSPTVKTYVALLDDELVGTYILRQNQPGLGAHVANAGYMVSSKARGKGIGRSMCAHSLDVARAEGYLAMQFNLVVSSNSFAVRLWQSMGFEIVGTLSKAFRHQTLGLVDAYVMYRLL